MTTLVDVLVMPAVGINCGQYPTHYRVIPHGAQPDAADLHSQSGDGQIWELREIVTIEVPTGWAVAADGDMYVPYQLTIL